MEVLCL